MWTRLRNFIKLPLFDKTNRLGTLYFQCKGVLLYRLIFRRFGSRSYIRKPMLIANPRFIQVGDNVSVQSGVRLEAIQSNPNRIPNLSIGSNTNIEQNVHIVCHSRVHIGENVSITGHCAIVDVTHDFTDVVDKTKIGHRILNEDSFVEIGDGAFIGFGSVILPNVCVGKNVIIGSNCVVTKSIPDYSVAVGAPARIARRYDFKKSAWVSIQEGAEIGMNK